MDGPENLKKKWLKSHNTLKKWVVQGHVSCIIEMWDFNHFFTFWLFFYFRLRSSISMNEWMALCTSNIHRKVITSHTSQTHCQLLVYQKKLASRQASFVSICHLDVRNGLVAGTFLPSKVANGHITLNTPVLVRSLKLSSVEPSQYLDGWPPGNTGCCWQHISFWQIILQAWWEVPVVTFLTPLPSPKIWQIKKPERISLWTNALWLCTFSSKEGRLDWRRKTN